MKTLPRTTTWLHVALHVQDLDRSIDFYRSLLGEEPDKVRPEYARFSADPPGLILALNAVSRPLPAGRLSHLGLRVPTQDQLDGARQRLLERGLELREEHESTCCYAVQNKFWVTDPDGNDWEVYRVLADADVYHSAPGERESGAACCAKVQ